MKTIKERNALAKSHIADNIIVCLILLSPGLCDVSEWGIALCFLLLYVLSEARNYIDKLYS